MASDADLVATARELAVRADTYDWSYQWNWAGLPIIQMPSDIVALQEIVWEHRPDLIIETGVARGGSVVFFASLLAMCGGGTVLGIDVDIRNHNRAAIEEHPMASGIELVEGSSVDAQLVAVIAERAARVERVMVVLDSDHSHDHVLAELRSYAPLVTPGQFLVVADTAIEEIPVQSHRPRHWGPGNSPASALAAWRKDPATRKLAAQFEADLFINEKVLVSASRGGYLRRIAP